MRGGLVVGKSRKVLRKTKVYLNKEIMLENVKSKIYSQEADCVSPTSGNMYTTTVELVNADNSQDEDGISECNPVLRAESQKIFQQYKPRVDHKGDKPRKRSRSRSRTRYHSQSRGRKIINKS